MDLDDQTPEDWREYNEQGTGLLLIGGVKVYAPNVLYSQAVQWATDKNATAVKWVPHSIASLQRLQDGCAVPIRFKTALEVLDSATVTTRSNIYTVNGVSIALDQPECLMCGELNPAPSMGGPLICALCDMGKHEDGTRWSMDEYKKRRHRMDMRVNETRVE